MPIPNYGSYNMQTAVPQQYQMPSIPTAVPLPQQPTQNNANLLTVLVTGEDEVNAYPLAPNTTVLLMSFDAGKFWVKSRGINGVPQPTRVFTFKEEPAQVVLQETGVTRKEFSELSEKLDKLINELGGGSK